MTGAQCGNPARWDLCGGPSARTVPTATTVGAFESSNPAIPAVSAEGADGADGIIASSDSGRAVVAVSGSGTGVIAASTSGSGIAGSSGTGTGVFALSDRGIGVHAVGGGATAADPPPVSAAAILAEGGPHTGLSAVTSTGIGISATATSPAGLALQVTGKVHIQGSSVGSVTMAANIKTLKVSNAAATADSLIFLTPLGPPQAFLWIGARSEGSFTIEASEETPNPVTIGFLIIN
jgi:hypothetical protein